MRNSIVSCVSTVYHVFCFFNDLWTMESQHGKLDIRSQRIPTAILSQIPCGLSSLVEYHFFSDPGPMNDRCPFPNLLAHKDTILACSLKEIFWTVGMHRPRTVTRALHAGRSPTCRGQWYVPSTLEKLTRSLGRTWLSILRNILLHSVSHLLPWFSPWPCSTSRLHVATLLIHLCHLLLQSPHQPRFRVRRTLRLCNRLQSARNTFLLALRYWGQFPWNDALNYVQHWNRGTTYADLERRESGPYIDWETAAPSRESIISTTITWGPPCRDAPASTSFASFAPGVSSIRQRRIQVRLKAHRPLRKRRDRK